MQRSDSHIMPPSARCESLRSELLDVLRLWNRAQAEDDPVAARLDLLAAVALLRALRPSPFGGRSEGAPADDDARPASDPHLDDVLDAQLGHPSQRLVVYGSLSPGCPNHHVVVNIPGRWVNGWVEGLLDPDGWGATGGYPGVVWRPGSSEIPIRCLESDTLPAHWERLDAFEGPAYRRIVVPVRDADGSFLIGSLYEVRNIPP